MSLLDTHKAQHLYSNVVIDELFCYHIMKLTNTNEMYYLLRPTLCWHNYVSLACVITSFTGKHHCNKKKGFSIVEAGRKFVTDE